MKPMDIYLTGVGGQGIGLISEILLRAADHAGMEVKGVDTHGLAQRGGIVVSQLRIGKQAHSPLIRRGSADLVISLERHEALRGAQGFLKSGGTLLYYDVAWQPLGVRLNQAAEITTQDIEHFCQKNGLKSVNVSVPDLKEARMQNIALLHAIYQLKLIPGVQKTDYMAAMEDLISGKMLEQNLALFESDRVKISTA